MDKAIDGLTERYNKIKIITIKVSKKDYKLKNGKAYLQVFSPDQIGEIVGVEGQTIRNILNNDRYKQKAKVELNHIKAPGPCVFITRQNWREFILPLKRIRKQMSIEGYKKWDNKIASKYVLVFPVSNVSIDDSNNLTIKLVSMYDAGLILGTNASMVSRWASNNLLYSTEKNNGLRLFALDEVERFERPSSKQWKRRNNTRELVLRDKRQNPNMTITSISTKFGLSARTISRIIRKHKNDEYKNNEFND